MKQPSYAAPSLWQFARINIIRFLCGLALMLPGSLLADEQVQVIHDVQEIKQLLQRIEAQNPATKTQWAGKKVILARLAKYKVALGGEAPVMAFEALHYRYDDGKTIRTRFRESDLVQLGKAEDLEAYPTPLAGEEQASALEWAQKLDPKIQLLVAKTSKPELRVSYLAPVISDRANPLFGQRIVIVQLLPISNIKEGLQATVNLTAGTLVK